MKWLIGISEELRNKLAAVDLVEAVAKRKARQLTVAQWVDEYIAERKDMKGSTRLTYDKARDNLVDYFGLKKRLRDVTTADAKKWRIWLATEGNRRDTKIGRKTLAYETVRQRTGKAKQFFAEAIERGLIDANPFTKLASTSQGNTKRQYFVPASWIEQCMDHCPCEDWKLILALARYGGLRCPSELVRLRWQDIDLPAGRMVIHASKTEHHSNGGARICPVFAELRPYLESAWDRAPDGADAVITRYRHSSQNLRTTFEKIIKAAGLTPWPRLLQNLRASRETELMAKWPAKDVASWLGNSVPIAMRHYAMATEEAFLKASEGAMELPGGSTTSISRADQASSNQIEHEEKTADSFVKSEETACLPDSVMAMSVAEAGLEPAQGLLPEGF